MVRQVWLSAETACCIRKNLRTNQRESKAIQPNEDDNTHLSSFSTPIQMQPSLESRVRITSW